VESNILAVLLSKFVARQLRAKPQAASANSVAAQ
jgi:hypothetical protein